MKLELSLPEEALTLAAGQWLAAGLASGGVLFLHGDLGAGKTTLSRGILRGLGYDGAVKSPTFTLVEPYDFPWGQVFHFDLYRLVDPEELEYLGVDDYFLSQQICLVEWPEKGGDRLPDADINVTIALNGQHREMQLASCSPRGETILKAFQQARIGNSPGNRSGNS